LQLKQTLQSKPSGRKFGHKLESPTGVVGQNKPSPKHFACASRPTIRLELGWGVTPVRVGFTLSVSVLARERPPKSGNFLHIIVTTANVKHEDWGPL
jgi:hypothetical protein